MNLLKELRISFPDSARRMFLIRGSLMRTYSIVNNVLRCDVEYRNQCGSLEYDFNLGIFHADKPAGVPSMVWLVQVIRFAKLARQMVLPMDNPDESAI